jgi:hypothetical protein
MHPLNEPIGDGLADATIDKFQLDLQNAILPAVPC